MRILITNDDGLYASQLIPLIRWCKRHGEVTVVVPKYEQSGKSHSIELHKAFEAKEVELAPDITVWAVDSSPADCVRFAVLGLHKEFDLVISGVNRGLNVGVDVMYSGTAAAIFEAGILGIQGIALSTSPDHYEDCISKLDMVYDIFKKHGLLEVHDLYNVNIPGEAIGYRFTHQGGPYFTDDFVLQENDMYMPTGKCIYEDIKDFELDSDATTNGYISIMPLTIVRTDMEVFKKIKKWNK